MKMAGIFDGAKLTICIPAFNEEKAIAQTLRALLAEMPNSEIIVVDDGSSDRTAEIVRETAGVTLISHGSNQGYGASLKTAFRHSTRDIIVWCDADGQHSAEDVIRISQAMLGEDKDAVIGVRGPGSNQVPGRVMGKFALQVIATFVAREKIPDLNSGLRAFRREILQRYLHLLPDGFSASSTTTIILMRRRYRIAYVPIITNERMGTSSVSVIVDGWRTLKLLLRFLILFNAFEFFSFVSVVQIASSMIYGISLAFFSGRGFPVFASTIFISGMLTFFMGIICDQIVAIRMEKLEK